MGESTWKKFTTVFVNFVENIFFNLGYAVANHPWRTIGISWSIVILSSFGLLNFYQEKHPFKLWVPVDSDFSRDTAWLLERYNAGYRSQFVLATAPNVLTPVVLSELGKINERIINIKADANNKEYSWSNICFKVPIITSFGSEDRKRRSINDTPISDIGSKSLFEHDFFAESIITASPQIREFDPSIDLDSSVYCGLIESLHMGCLQRSILDLWKYNTTIIENLTAEDIIEKLNKTKTSPVLGHAMEYTSTLGGVQRNAEGKIVAAQSILLVWLVHVNFTSVNMAETGNQAGTEEWASEAALSWEKKFLEVMTQAADDTSVMNLYYEAGRTYGDLSGQTLFQDVDKIMIGIGLMFVYIQLILSKFNWVEVKFTLGSVGLLCVAMALVVACGVCSALGIPYGPVHTSLPFLLMGLGIDDMFVMKACWDHLSDVEKKLPLPDKIGLMLQHAGVSIVITSFTDVVAFLVGSITILPSLQSFCYYAAVGVFFMFVFSVTFYVAIFVLDVKRAEAQRNGLLFCIKHKDYVPTPPGQQSVSQFIIHKLYSKIIFSKLMKAIVIICTVIMAAFSFESLLRLEQKFDPSWFIPENSYYNDFINQRKLYYPDMGYEATVFIGAINYSEELPKIYSVVNKLHNETGTLHMIDSWTESFKSYVLLNFNHDVDNTPLSDLNWRSYLSKYLFSPVGAKYQGKFRFDGELKCGEPTPPVTVSSIDFRFRIFLGPKVYLPAMHKIKNIIKDVNFTTGDKVATLWAKVFANWASDEIIQVEVERNLELALVCVMACTFILITDIQICFWIFMCVLLTLVNVCGWMQRWGLTVDIVACVGLELAVGLCVDYAAHMGHTFLTLRGSREERALHTVTSIGAAVMYGGGSTLLSLSVMSISETYIFKSFFKIFLLVIIFGLFHGVVFLPVILSLIGPDSYKRNDKNPPVKRYSAKESHNNEQLEVINLNDVS